MCEWNDFVIFHENITFWALFRSGLNKIWVDIHSDLLLNLVFICKLKFYHIAIKGYVLLAANYSKLDTLWFDLM